MRLESHGQPVLLHCTTISEQTTAMRWRMLTFPPQTAVKQIMSSNSSQSNKADSNSKFTSLKASTITHKESA
jgi:hypothetical protein